jgi:hypothetical protein
MQVVVWRARVQALVGWEPSGEMMVVWRAKLYLTLKTNKNYFFG